MVNAKQMVDTLMVAVLDEDMLKDYRIIARNECGDKYQVYNVEVIRGTSGQCTVYINFNTDSLF